VTGFCLLLLIGTIALSPLPGLLSGFGDKKALD